MSARAGLGLRADDDDEPEGRGHEKDGTPPTPVLMKLLERRKILLMDPVDAELAQRIIAQLLYLEGASAKDPIQILINSPGGDVASGLAIYDTIRGLSAPVECICSGLTASIATIILIAAEKGRRLAQKNARILIHQPLGGIRGQATDIDIHAREILKTKQHLNKMLAEATGQSLDKIEKDTNRDFWMSAEEAKSYGLVDAILEYRR